MSKALAFPKLAGWCSLLVGLSACTAEISSSDGGGWPTGKDGNSATPDLPGGGGGDLPPVKPNTERGGTSVVPTTTLDPGRVVLRRLNRTEYDNTVRDLLGSASTPARSTPFAADDVADGFDTLGQNLIMSLLLAEQLDKATSTLVDELLARPSGDAVRTRILSCEVTTANAATCLPEVLSNFMKSAYRRPVTAEEVQTRVKLATGIQQAGGDAKAGLAAALKSILLSPHFLYRVELGDPASPAATPLNDYELATRLSYMLWASMPDQSLFEAAEGKKLTPAAAELDAQVDRMLADPKADGFIDGFAGQWLSTRDAAVFVADETKFPQYDDALRLSMPRETNLFFNALLHEKQPLSALLLADFTFVNDRLAKQYGLAVAGADFMRVSLAGTPRAGILTQGSVLSVTSYPARTSPVKRADWVLERLLCDPPPAAPPMVPALADELPVGATLRQTFEAHRKDPACASCHRIMDPIGFALENFDAMGTYRTEDNGVPVDSGGVLADGTPVNGPADLAQAIATDADFPICVAKQLLTYAIGRSFSSFEAKAYAAGVGVRMKDGTWPEFLKAVVRSEAFRTRRGEAP
jgi:hypothetical protein